MRNQNYEEAKRWIAQAEEDLASCKWDIKGSFYASACFKAHQASEKALKACSYIQGKREVLTHSTRELIMDNSKKWKDLDRFLPYTKKLDKYHIIARYPNGWPAGIPSDYLGNAEAEEASKMAEEILCEIKKLMS